MIARTMMATATALLTATALSAQMPGMQRDSAGMPGMMQGQDGGMGQMMMGGMMGEGMMGPEMMQMMMGRGMSMMGTGGPGPAALLRMSESLGLSDAQVEEIESIRDAHQGAMQTHMSAAMESHGQARATLDGDDPDLQAYRDALEGAADHMVQAHVAMAEATLQARDVLTPEQRDQLQGGMGMMMDGMGMMGGSGMPGDQAPRSQGSGGAHAH